MQDEFIVAHVNRVAGVGTALIAGDDIDVFGKYVDDLAFALITPLASDDHGAHTAGPPLEITRHASGSTK